MKKPNCKECGKSDKVVLVNYGIKNVIWETDYECERCNCVVKIVKNYVEDTYRLIKKIKGVRNCSFCGTPSPKDRLIPQDDGYFLCFDCDKKRTLTEKKRGEK